MSKKQSSRQRFNWQLRAKAETRLANKGRSTQHADDLLHELRVHQLELEMQNEELLRIRTALEVSRDRYVQLYDFAPVCYLMLTKEGLITEANLTCTSFFGVERNELINDHFEHYVAAKNIDCWHKHFLHIRQHRDKQNYELIMHRADGTFFHARLDCLQADDVSSALHITLTDITERKRAEEALRDAAAAFETQDGIIVTDARQIILRANPAFTRITGYSAEESIGRTPSFLRSGVHDEDFYQALWAGMMRDGYWHGEIWNKCKNGQIFPAWVTITAVTDEDGSLAHYVGSFTDITVQKQAERVLLDARQRLESQVATTQEEMEKIKAESAEINAALSVLLKRREADKSEAQNALSREMNGSVFPFLKKLKKASTDRKQARLIDILENNLQHLAKSYGRASSLPVAYWRLTPAEAQIASMVRQGLSTKLIAAALNLSPGTISIHRKHIRKKLGFDSKAVNLRSYLTALDK